MRVPEHCTADAGMFFDGHPAELALYEALFRRMDGAFPEGTVKVQKSQISFYGRHLFAAASLPVRRRKDWPKMCLMVTVGLPYRLDSPRHPPGRGALSRPLDPPCLGDRGGPDRRRADGLAAGGMGLCGEQAMRYTREELAEARRSIDSTLRKCEKALEKLRPGTSPHTLTVRRIRAFRIALALIDREMDGTEIPGPEGKEDL